MKKLVEGIHQFQTGVFDSKRRLFRNLVDGQHPQALLITCSDSRVNPYLLTQSEPGDLFVMRNAGNIVPCYQEAGGGEAATIEFAVDVLRVKDIVVCGHSHCGAMAALLDPSGLEKLPAVRAWLLHAQPTTRIIDESYAHVTDAATRLAVTIQENVLVQIEHLRTHPTVQRALAEERLNLHGWMYKFETGQVFSYDPVTAQYAPVSPDS